MNWRRKPVLHCSWVHMGILHKSHYCFKRCHYCPGYRGARYPERNH